MTTNFNQLELMLKFSSPQSSDTFSEMRWLEMARRRCRIIKKRGFILLMSPLANDLKINFGRSFNDFHTVAYFIFNKLLVFNVPFAVYVVWCVYYFLVSFFFVCDFLCEI